MKECSFKWRVPTLAYAGERFSREVADSKQPRGGDWFDAKASLCPTYSWHRVQVSLRTATLCSELATLYILAEL